MLACVTLRTADGALHTLGHGDIVGRLWTAALQLSDPRVSEAHAMVSLRGGQLSLLALRGLFAVEGTPHKELPLEPGQRIAFARELEVVVEEVRLPDHVLGLEGDGLGRVALPGACALRMRPTPALSTRVREGHDAAFWSTGDGWMVQRPGGAPAPLAAGWVLEVGGARVEAVRIALQGASQARTIAQGAVQAPLRIELHWDTAHLHREGHPSLTLTGHPARLLTELAGVGTAAAWADLARALWRDEPERDRLRRRFDTVLGRLRRQLRGAGIRPDLIKPDGAGNFSLVLLPQDRVDDRS